LDLKSWIKITNTAGSTTTLASIAITLVTSNNSTNITNTGIYTKGREEGNPGIWSIISDGRTSCDIIFDNGKRKEGEEKREKEEMKKWMNMRECFW